jgi:hypothetical protein
VEAMTQSNVVVEILKAATWIPDKPELDIQKAIRIAEIEHEIVQKVKHGASRDSLRELIEKHSEAFK